MSPRLTLGLVLISAAITLMVLGRLLRRDDVSAVVIALVLTVLPCIIVPELWRDIALSMLIALAATFAADTLVAKLAVAAISGGLFFGLSWLVPGGGSVVLLGMALLGFGIFLVQSLSHWRRLKRATLLELGRTVKGEVEVGGTSRQSGSLPTLPGIDLPKSLAGYRLADDHQRATPELLPVETTKGVIAVKLSEVSIEDAPILTPALDKVEAFKKVLGLEKVSAVEVIEADKEVYVIGKPEWTRFSEGAATYRDAPTVPCFGAGSTLHLRSEADVDREALWSLVYATVFILSYGAIVIAQASGYAP